MQAEKDEKLEKRVADIRAVRQLLAEGSEQPLIRPWAFFAWAVLVAAGSLVHYFAFRRFGWSEGTALLRVWLPVLLLGGAAEAVSFGQTVNSAKTPLFNRRFGGALLGATASLIILTAVVVRLSLAQAMTPGLAVAIGAFVVVFYAQICYAALFAEAFAGIAVGVALELAGADGPAAFLAAGFFLAALYAFSGWHFGIIARRRHG
jgi:hypothetical protein